MCGIVGIFGTSRSRANWSMRSSGSNTAAMIPPASPTLEHGALTRAAPKASSGIWKAARARAARRHDRHRPHPLGDPRPAERDNAHPHATDAVAVVHNGIIENFRELREELRKHGPKFVTETDTEVVAHLVTEEMKRGHSPAEAVAASLKQLRGAFALAFLFAGEDDLLIGARKGSPLAIGFGKDSSRGRPLRAPIDKYSWPVNRNASAIRRAVV